jgi:hypothetical protein
MGTTQTIPEDHIWTGAEIQELLDTQVKYRDWKFIVQEEYAQRDGIMDTDLHLRVEWYCPDNVTGAVEKQQSRWWRLSKHMRKNEIINTAFACIKMAEEHEMRESFLYRLGDHWTMPYNTHTDVDELAAASAKIDIRIDTRPSAPANQRRD